MKPNVDLTENQIFTTRKQVVTFIDVPHGPAEEQTLCMQIFMDILERTLPWDYEHLPRMIESDADFVENKQSLIATGNKDDRKNWYQNRTFVSGEVCWMCGRHVGKKPWAKNRCKCWDFQIEKKIPWRY